MNDFLSRMTPLAWVMLLLALSSILSIVFRLATWRSRPRVAATPTYNRGCLAGLIGGIAIGIMIGIAISLFYQLYSMRFR